MGRRAQKNTFVLRTQPPCDVLPYCSFAWWQIWQAESMHELQPDQQYRAYLAVGRFMIQRALLSGAYFFYPRVLEPASGSEQWEWVEASGLGTVYSTTVVRVRRPAADYNVALIDLAEGPRMMSRLIGVPPEEVRIGMQVRARIQDIEGVPAVVFEPLADSA